MSSAESNYSNIEREALGVIEAVKYFHKFIAGRKFTICSDHRPLQFILNNSSVPDRVLARLQRWAVTFHAYDYEIHHVRGETMYIVMDTLSRIPRRDSKSLVHTVNILDVNSIQEFVQRESLLSRIASSSNTSLSRLKKYIVSGWPQTHSCRHAAVRKVPGRIFYSRRHYFPWLAYRTTCLPTISHFTFIAHGLSWNHTYATICACQYF